MTDTARLLRTRDGDDGIHMYMLDDDAYLDPWDDDDFSFPFFSFPLTHPLSPCCVHAYFLPRSRAGATLGTTTVTTVTTSTTNRQPMTFCTASVVQKRIPRFPVCALYRICARTVRKKRTCIATCSLLQKHAVPWHARYAPPRRTRRTHIGACGVVPCSSAFLCLGIFPRSFIVWPLRGVQHATKQ